MNIADPNLYGKLCALNSGSTQFEETQFAPRWAKRLPGQVGGAIIGGATGLAAGSAVGAPGIGLGAGGTYGAMTGGDLSEIKFLSDELAELSHRTSLPWSHYYASEEERQNEADRAAEILNKLELLRNKHPLLSALIG